MVLNIFLRRKMSWISSVKSAPISWWLLTNVRREPVIIIMPGIHSGWLRGGWNGVSRVLTKLHRYTVTSKIYFRSFRDVLTGIWERKPQNMPYPWTEPAMRSVVWLSENLLKKCMPWSRSSIVYCLRINHVIWWESGRLKIYSKVYKGE